MARPISDEELQLKKRARRRLVGAVVLVSGVAVILPMVLDSEPRPVSQNVDIQIPSPDAPEPKAKPAASAPPPVVASPIRGMPAAPPEKAGDAKGETAAAATEKAPESATREADKAEAKASPKESPKVAAKEPPKPTADGAYVVQVAALADAARVKQLQKQMTAAGVKPFTEAVKTNGTEVTRVRAGPYATREAAESARSQLKKAGLDGKVVPK